MWNRSIFAAIWTISLAGCPADVPASDGAAVAWGYDAPLDAGVGQVQPASRAVCYAENAAGRGTAVLDITGAGYDIHGRYDVRCGPAWFDDGVPTGVMFEVCEPTFTLRVSNLDLRVSGNQADPAVAPVWKIYNFVLNDLYLDLDNFDDPSVTKIVFGSMNAAGKIQGATVDAYVSRDFWDPNDEEAHALATFDCDG
jgi:hypothetical protein